MRHWWIDTTLPQELRDKHELLRGAPLQSENCFACGVSRTDENADAECMPNPLAHKWAEPDEMARAQKPGSTKP